MPIGASYQIIRSAIKVDEGSACSATDLDSLLVEIYAGDNLGDLSNVMGI